MAGSSKIDINRAANADLETVDGLGPKTAKAVIAHRDAKGRFRTLDELLEIDGIGAATLERLRSSLVVEPAAKVKATSANADRRSSLPSDNFEPPFAKLFFEQGLAVAHLTGAMMFARTLGDVLEVQTEFLIDSANRLRRLQDEVDNFRGAFDG